MIEEDFLIGQSLQVEVAVNHQESGNGSYDEQSLTSMDIFTVVSFFIGLFSGYIIAYFRYQQRTIQFNFSKTNSEHNQKLALKAEYVKEFEDILMRKSSLSLRDFQIRYWGLQSRQYQEFIDGRIYDQDFLGWMQKRYEEFTENKPVYTLPGTTEIYDLNKLLENGRTSKIIDINNEWVTFFQQMKNHAGTGYPKVIDLLRERKTDFNEQDKNQTIEQIRKLRNNSN